MHSKSTSVKDSCKEQVILALRKKKFTTKVQLAHKLQIASSTVYNFFNGHKVSWDCFIKICEELGLKYETIATDFNFEEISAPTTTTPTQERQGEAEIKIIENPNIVSESFEQHLASWKVGKKLIYSAPSATFFVGEHAVVYGHIAIYYPLPLRLYVHIEPDYDTNKITFNEYKVPDPNQVSEIKPVEYIKDYGSCGVPHQTEAINNLFKSVIHPFLGKKSGFKINVLSSFPIAVGLNSSGAFSVCFAQGLVDNFLNIEEFKKHFNLQGRDTKKIVLTLAWAIENCFHHFSSSGAGIHASFFGREGKHPLIYCSAKRSNLAHRKAKGCRPVNVGQGEEALKNLLAIETFIFDPAAAIVYPTENTDTGNLPINIPPYSNPPNYNITVLYSGSHSPTEAVLATYGGIRRFSSGSTERVNYIHEKFRTAFPENNFQRSLEIHSEILSNIYLNQSLEDKDKELEYAYKELMMEALGNIGVGILNSVLSDWQFVPELMNSCQHLLSSGGLSNQRIDAFVTRLQAQAIQYQIDNSEPLIKIGAKLTGAGKGGDIIVLSLYDHDVHRNLIEKAMNDNYTIHFSCAVSRDEDGIQVDGVKREQP